MTALPPLFQGVWTPAAEVLCFHCHGTEIRGKALPKDVLDPLPSQTPPAGQDATTCDACGRRVVLSSQVAHEHALARRLLADERLLGEIAGARMTQTGGMCSAMKVTAFGGSCYFYVTEDDEHDRKYRIGLYEPLDEDGQEREGKGVEGLIDDDDVVGAILRALRERQQVKS